MIIPRKINGTSQRIMSNAHVVLAIINDGHGRYTWNAYVHHTKTIHEFDAPSKMLDFIEHMGLVAANKTLTRTEFKHRIRPFVLRKWTERCEPGMDLIKALLAIEKGHVMSRGTGIMAETTWTEFDEHALFLIPKGVWLTDDPTEESEPEFHARGNGWIYEILHEVVAELCKIFDN